MNAPGELNFEDMLRIRLNVLMRQHRDLDDAIHALQESSRADALTLRRLKKQKLALKDQIVKIEDQLDPRHHRLRPRGLRREYLPKVQWACLALGFRPR